MKHYSFKESDFTQRRKENTKGAKGNSLCTFAFFAPLREIFYEVAGVGDTSLNPLPCIFTISIFGSSFRYFLNFAIYTSMLRPLKYVSLPQIFFRACSLGNKSFKCSDNSFSNSFSLGDKVCVC